VTRGLMPAYACLFPFMLADVRRRTSRAIFVP
jgi:hypothetical protein